MKIFIGMSALALISGLAMADTINGPASTAFPSPISTGLNSGVPYWDNSSGDFSGAASAFGNIGYFLTSTGGDFSGTNLLPTTYESAASGTPNPPSAFNLVHTTNSLIISLIGVNTGNMTDVFGIYNASLTGASAIASEVSLLGSSNAVGTTAANQGASYANVGFYLTDSVGATWFSNTALNVNGTSGDAAAHQHFTIFTTSTDANTFYVGVEDWVSKASGGDDDYNDVVIKINADAAAVPEPATFGMLGAGLLGLGFARFRNRKNRA